MKKITTYEKTRTIFPIFTLICRVIAFFGRLFEGAKLKKIGRMPKPPYLCLCNHASFMDYFICLKQAEPYQPYWISTIEEYIDKDFVFRELGAIPKRKFTNDPVSAKMTMEVLKDRKKILIIYPEARYSFVGRVERIDKSLAKLAKACSVPVVIISTHGHYLRDPQWGDHKIRKVRPIRSESRCVISKKYVQQLPVEEIQQIIEENFVHNDEQYQLDNHIKITYPKRAEGIHRILYKCPHCGKEFMMSSSGTTFKCDCCGIQYNLNEDGTISCLNGETKFRLPSEWYYWEKECVREEVKNGTYRFEDDIRLEHLEGVGVGFIPMEGKYHFIQSYEEGIKVTSDNGFSYSRSPLQSYAIHIEFDYHGRGACIDLATNTETYFAYPLNCPQAVTKIHFAAEVIYDLQKENLKK